MKILISYFLLFLGLVCQSDAQTTTTTPKVNVSISSRGRRPETSGCSDGGLTCPQSIVAMTTAQSKGTSSLSLPYMSVDGLGHFVWYIPKNYLPSEMENLTFYKKQAFFVEEPFILDPVVVERLQAETTATNVVRISAGMYPIIELPDGYIVRF